MRLRLNGYPKQAVYRANEPTHTYFRLTTSVLITTILEYAIRAGITAGAGTRLFL